jgi:hypothetical protein
MIVPHLWFEFQARVIKLFCNASDCLDLGWQDIHGSVQWRPIRMIAILYSTILFVQQLIFIENSTFSTKGDMLHKRALFGQAEQRAEIKERPNSVFPFGLHLRGPDTGRMGSTLKKQNSLVWPITPMKSNRRSDDILASICGVN